jgi:hypothetical protein
MVKELSNARGRSTINCIIVDFNFTDSRVVLINWDKLNLLFEQWSKDYRDFCINLRLVG